MPVFKFKAEFTVRAADKQAAEAEVAEEMGQDVYEGHFICDEITEFDGMEVDVDLIKV